jgi:hypothetical protein
MLCFLFSVANTKNNSVWKENEVGPLFFFLFFFSLSTVSWLLNVIGYLFHFTEFRAFLVLRFFLLCVIKIKKENR